jgi:hypothetical protein
MKVFWAWQADTPGKIGRHFVREALEEAIERLKQPKDIEEPPEESRRSDLHLDHDTKGLKGAPEVAHEIFKKIEASTVVVADVTPIGTAPAEEGQPPKPLMNANVAIELGYAFGKLGTDCFLPVLNLAYGDVESLPFDIAHRRHPISFTLATGAVRADIEREKTQLVGQFVIALEPYLSGPPAVAAPTFKKAEAKIPPAIFFEEGEILYRIPHFRLEYAMSARSVFYMRVIPRVQEGHLDIHLLMQRVAGYGVFGLPAGSFTYETTNGVLCGTPNGTTNEVDDVIKYFRTGEIWAVNGDLFRNRASDGHRYLYTQPFENILVNGLASAMKFHQEVSHIPPPFEVEVGAVGIEGLRIAHTGRVINKAPVLASDTVIHTAVLNNVDQSTQRKFLMEFFEKLQRDSGVPRPKDLYQWG